MDKNIIVCLNMDTVKNKNLYQFDSMARFGYHYIVCGYLEDRATKTSNNYTYTIYPKVLSTRIWFVLCMFLRNRKKIHHIELYTANNGFVFIEFLLSKIFCFHICMVERGAALREKIEFSFFRRYFFNLLFKFADSVWIRELWMAHELEKIRKKKKIFFIPNCIEIPNESSHTANKSIDFIWCNSLKEWRNAPWFIDALNNQKLIESRAVLIGTISDNVSVSKHKEYAEKNQPKNLEIYAFQDPKSFFLKSRFFILPADIVYLNFSLLEAMAYGVVPIVSGVEGASDIVTHKEEGFVIEHSQEGLERTMVEALGIDDETYLRLSINARQKIIDKFSIAGWSEKLLDMYAHIVPKRCL